MNLLFKYNTQSFITAARSKGWGIQISAVNESAEIFHNFKTVNFDTYALDTYATSYIIEKIEQTFAEIPNDSKLPKQKRWKRVNFSIDEGKIKIN